MSAIAGIADLGRREQVVQMIENLSHRGRERSKTIERHNAILQASWNGIESRSAPSLLQKNAVWDGTPPPEMTPKALARWTQPFALAGVSSRGMFLARGPLGAKPLYYGETDGSLCFASEVKTLLTVTDDVNEFPPGTWYTPQDGFRAYTTVETGELPYDDVNRIIAELRRRLENAVARNVVSEPMGVWLSGGVDSSVIAALARKYVKELLSFVIGLKGAPDVEYGGQMAAFLGIEHHALTITLADLLAALPTVIYYLESFDALLVRSSITNYLASKVAADYVSTVFSGEGGDELFAGYEYMKAIPSDNLSQELEEAVGRLHNTAFQRVDRCACAHGIVPIVPFADMDVVRYALSIPTRYKIYRNQDPAIEKWILRRTIDGMIPDSVLWRPKTKFWQGTGVQELLANYAESAITDGDFRRERHLSNGWTLNSKEELMYYRVFQEHFGDISRLEWMGRTKGSPVQ